MSAPRTPPVTAPRTILDAWPDLVDAHTGIVRELVELRVDDDEPPFVHYLSYACSTEAFGLLANFGNNGGVGTSPHGAIAKALGEAVERYCSAVFTPEDLRWSCYADLDEPATPPGSYALYSAAQYARPGFPWRPFEPDSPVAWTYGRSLVTGRHVLVPAAFVHVPYHYTSGRPDTPITQPISTGLACGSSAAEATLSALCEVVERDAFTLTWQGRLARPRIRAASLPARLTELVGRYASVGLTVHLVDITTDTACPTVLAVAEGFAATSPAVAVAAASHLDPAVAARKSLEELAHTRKFAAQVMDHLPAVPVDVEGGHPAVDGQRAHLRLYCPQEAKAMAGFLWSGPEETELGAVAGGARHDLDGLVTRIADLGEDVVACELTTPDVAELGLAVVRVVVPGLHPLQMGHANRCLGGWRLAALPHVRRPDGWSPDRDNPYPHPFP